MGHLLTLVKPQYTGGIEDHIVHRTLRRGVNEHGLQVLVETSEYESTDQNEKHAKRRLHGMAYRQGLIAPALQRFARQKPNDQ